MPIQKLLGNTPDAMNSEEGNASLDTFIRQAVGKEPLFSFSRNGDGPTQWIHLLHNFDQPDLSGWPLLAPMKVQMQKCDKCAREFSSSINYRRHIKVHRQSMKFHKDPQKYRDLLGAFWDKLTYDEAREIMSFENVKLEEVPGSSIVNKIAANLRKTTFLSFPQVYVKAGSALVNIVQGRASMLPVSSQELFSVLDDASERTFLCAGTAESLQKYVFDRDAGKIGSEVRNVIACTSFLVEQQLVKAWFADKDAEALRCQKLLVDEEDAAQRRQADRLERKRRRKIRQKEQRARDHSNGVEPELNTANVIFESISSAETSNPQTSPEVDPLTTDEYVADPLDPIQFISNEEVIDIETQGRCGSDHSDSATAEQQKMQGNGSPHFIARWQVAESQRSGRNGLHSNQNGTMIKREPAHKHREQRVNGGKIWTKKPKSGNGELVTSRIHDDAIIQAQATTSNDEINKTQTTSSNCQLMIGSISVIVRTSTGQHQVNSQAGVQENRKTEIKMKNVQNGANCSNVKFWRPRHDTRGQLREKSNTPTAEEATSERGTDPILSTDNQHPSCDLNGNDCEGANDSNVEAEDDAKPEGVSFSIDAAKAFLSQRWKEAISGDHVELVLTSAPEPPGQHDNQASDAQECNVGIPNGQPAKAAEIDSPINANVKPKFRTKPEKNTKIKYIPKCRVI